MSHPSPRPLRRRPGGLTVVLVALVLVLGGMVLFLLARERSVPRVVTPPAKTAAQAPVSVPATFQGEWNMNIAHCGTGVNDSRLVIEEDRIIFYETGGPIRAVVVHAPNDISLTAEITGEGETSVQTHRYRLSEDESALTEVTDGGGLVRQRCPMRG